MNNVIEVKNLKTYFTTPSGIARAVDNVSFEIKKGETFALVGESGCGKSVTALSLIQLAPEGHIAGGEILLNGKDITRLSERAKRDIRGNNISMIFQEPMTSLNPVFTIGEQISETIRLHQKKARGEAREIAIEVLSSVGLPEQLYGEYPHRLSGGQRQRVMIAIALSCRPDLLIADEPTTALDVTIQDQILRLIKELKTKLNTAVLLITHNLALVAENAEEVAVMYAGKIVERTQTKTLFEKPLHPYTLKLLNSIPARKKKDTPLDTIPGAVPPATLYPEGCRFSGRCQNEMQGCKGREPLLVEREAGHLVACHVHDRGFMKTELSRPITRYAEEKAPSIVLSRETTAVIEVRGLKKYYPIRKGILKKIKGYVKAVDGIDLSISKGETFALVGESGCGKTTAGKSIIQLLKPDEGEVRFKGKDISRLRENELKDMRSLIQIIFQDPYSSLNPRMMTGEIIEEGIRSLKPALTKSERQKLIMITLERVGLSEEAMRRYPHEFSGGQRQRIGIARALAVEPEFIVCDEAVSSLDVSVQAQILNLLKTIQMETGISYLFITHDLAVVEYMADHVAVMYNGKIVERGTVDEVFSNPQNEYTRTLLDAVPRLEGKSI
ncbi:MAG: ABC transporter ATP-binding protein [Deltaproteobacteria bacterium]|nr:ABC transporter ATP-binding protein [Deltaproteobacteria bacterium]